MNHRLFSSPYKRGLQVVLLLAMLLLSLGPAGTQIVLAAPPGNDTLANAKVINSLVYLDSLSTTEATPPNESPSEPADPDSIPCEDNTLNAGYASVWYSYTPSVGESITMDTIGSKDPMGEEYDTYMAIWTGTAGSLNLVACNDDAYAGYTSELFFTGVAGTTYYIEIAQWSYYENTPPNPLPDPPNPPGGNLEFHAYISNVNVVIAGDTVGKYYVPAQGSLRKRYVLDNGPVEIFNTAGTPIIAALRDAWINANGQATSFAQLMGLPKEQLSDTYVFPAYNNITLSEQIRIGNVDTVATDVTVKIAGVPQPGSPHHLLPNQSIRLTYNLDTGPVEVKSTGQKIIAAIRDAWLVNGQVTSFTQVMGMPKESLSDTYVFPAYNNISLSEQIRIGNVDTVPTDVLVTIAGVPQNSGVAYHLEASQSVRLTYPLDAGPVEVKGTAGVKIITAIRDAWLVNGQVVSYAQLMGMPKEKLSDTYVFPAYNNISLNGQLRFGNVDTVATDVTVTIAGVVQNGGVPYHLEQSQSLRVTYPLDAGPVEVKGTTGVKIIAALRDAWLLNGQATSFVQLMGMPKESLSTTYYIPAYNNITLNGQLRFGQP